MIFPGCLADLVSGIELLGQANIKESIVFGNSKEVVEIIYKPLYNVCYIK